MASIIKTMQPHAVRVLAFAAKRWAAGSNEALSRSLAHVAVTTTAAMMPCAVPEAATPFVTTDAPMRVTARA